MIMQPLIGAWSDRTNTRWGKRKPFIFGGLVIVVFALVIFSNCDAIGLALGDRMFIGGLIYHISFSTFM